MSDGDYSFGGSASPAAPASPAGADSAESDAAGHVTVVTYPSMPQTTSTTTSGASRSSKLKQIASPDAIGSGSTSWSLVSASPPPFPIQETDSSGNGVVHSVAPAAPEGRSGRGGGSIGQKE